MFAVDTLSHDLFSNRQSSTVIDTQTFVEITQFISSHLFTSCFKDTNNICQIILSLGIVGIDIFECFKKTFIVKDVSACVDFSDLLFKVCGVFFLDNLGHFLV